MRKIFLIFFFFMVLLPYIGLAKENILKEHAQQHFCSNEELGIRYYCEPEWKRRDIDDAVLTIISSSPAVTLTITKIESNIVFLEQLTKSVLEEKELYADGFQVDHVKFSDKEAIQVKAFSKRYAGRRILDYYFIHNSKLYAILFSVHPKENWDEYKYLIKKIGESFQFFEKRFR